MGITLDVRRAVPEDAAAMARVHVVTWRETYRGLMKDAVLDDPGLLSRREKFWAGALTDPKYKENKVAVAYHGSNLIGISMAGRASGDTPGPQQLHLFYAYAAFHGSGVGAALLNAVIDPVEPASLWVADPNPRAQAFYPKNGFATDGAVKLEEDLREIRMVRTAEAERS